MKKILLTRGLHAIVDNNVYPELVKHKWHAMLGRDTFYAVRKTKGTGGSRGTILMHREVLRVQCNEEIDHVNRNGLDNRRTNLRASSRSQNSANRGRQINSGKYKGVHRTANKERWRARIQVNGEGIYLGTFDDAVDAALTYDVAAREHFGEFACTNFGG